MRMQSLRTKEGAKKAAVFAALFLAGAFSRIPFRGSFLYSWDSVQFAMALEHYDPWVHQPHPPGYFLYVMLGRLFALFIDDPNTVFITISILFSGLLVVAVYTLALELLRSRGVALVAAALMLTSPLAWLYGSVAAIYVPEAFLCISFALICVRLHQGRQGLLVWSAVMLAVIAGFRQSTALFMLPLWVYSVRGYPRMRLLYAAAAGLAALALWLVPMLEMSGGLDRYRAASSEMWEFAVRPVMPLVTGPGQSVVFTGVLLKNIFYGTGISLALALACAFMSPGRSLRAILGHEGRVLGLMALPAAAFFVLVFNSPANPGLNLIVIPPLAIAASAAMLAVKLPGNISHGLPQKALAFAVIAAAVLFNMYFFLVRDTTVSGSFPKRQGAFVSRFTDTVRAWFSPSEAAIFGNMFFYAGPRHHMYYLPEFTVFVYDPSEDRQGRARQVFYGRKGRTYTSPYMDIPAGVRYFLISSLDRDLLYRLRPTELAKVRELRSSSGDLVGYYGDIAYAPALFRPVNVRLPHEGGAIQ